jgi:tetratricopeptide (TPR) repeat protein
MAVTLASSASAQTQAEIGWIGKRVITTYGTVLRVGDQVVDDAGRAKNLARGKEQQAFRIYRVEQVKGPWLWLVAEGSGVKGWAPAANVILFDQAIEYITNRIRANPGAPSNYLWRGTVWSRWNELDNAIADYNEAIRLDPNRAAPFVARGNALRAKDDYDKAIADYTEAIRLDPGSALAYLARGRAWRAKKDYDRAIADYTEAIRLDPAYALALNNRGNAWCDKKDYDKAIADYTEAIRLDPGCSIAHFNRGLASLLIGSGEAVADERKLLDLEGWRGEFSQYAAILGHLGARRAGKLGAAKQFLVDAAARCDASAWPYPVIRYLHGGINERALLAEAIDNGEMTEARSYLGLDLAIQGEAVGAREQLLWVKKHGNPAFPESTIALAELDRLEKDAGRSGTWGTERAGSSPRRR